MVADQRLNGIELMDRWIFIQVESVLHLNGSSEGAFPVSIALLSVWVRVQHSTLMTTDLKLLHPRKRLALLLYLAPNSA